MTSNPGPVLVTGGTGFVGAHLCASLRASGVPVRVLTRNPTARHDPDTFVAAGDVEPAVGRAMQEVRTVVHLAGLAHERAQANGDSLAVFRRANVDWTRTILAHAAAAGIQSFVFASSIKVMGRYPGRPWREDDEPAPDDAYGVSKLEAERLVLAAAENGGPRPVILRFPLIYGPGVRANMLRLFDKVWNRALLPFGAVKNERSVLYVGNAVSALTAAAFTRSFSGHTFFLDDGEPLATPELIHLIGRALRRPARLIGVPVPLLLALAAFAGALPRSIRPPFTTTEASRLLGSAVVDSRRFRREFAFQCPATTEEGIARTAQWYATSRGLPLPLDAVAATDC